MLVDALRSLDQVEEARQAASRGLLATDSGPLRESAAAVLATRFRGAGNLDEVTGWLREVSHEKGRDLVGQAERALRLGP